MDRKPGWQARAALARKRKEARTQEQRAAPNSDHGEVVMRWEELRRQEDALREALVGEIRDVLGRVASLLEKLK